MLQAKKIPAVAMETEYQRSFQAMATPTRPRPIQRLHHHKTPLFHTYMVYTHTHTQRLTHTHVYTHSRFIAAGQQKVEGGAKEGSSTHRCGHNPQIRRGSAPTGVGGTQVCVVCPYVVCLCVFHSCPVILLLPLGHRRGAEQREKTRRR